METKKQEEIQKVQSEEQKSLYKERILYEERTENEALLNEKKKAATILYHLIPEIAWDGFQVYKKAIVYPITIFSDFDYINALNILKDELDDMEMLYMVKLFANIAAIKTTTPNTTEFEYSYREFLQGFCNGYVTCGPYFSFNYHNKNVNMPFDRISEYPPDQITKDFILETSYSNFVNDNNRNGIFLKLKKIKDSGTAKG
jgi:hypothetical protein